MISTIGLQDILWSDFDTFVKESDNIRNFYGLFIEIGMERVEFIRQDFLFVN